MREALFARLGGLDGARVLDLYAGGGALGIEALSRGAAAAVFVERASASLASLGANLAALAVGEDARVLRGEAVAALRRLGREGRQYDLVLLDPPYRAGVAERTLRAIAEAGILAPGATVVAKVSRRHLPGDVAGLAVLDERRYGDTLILRYREASTTNDD